MERNQAILMLPLGALLEFTGVLTLITNDGMLIPRMDLGFSIPAVLPVEVQGIGLMMAGGLTTLYAVKNMQ